jgi:hypothetical protein
MHAYQRNQNVGRWTALAFLAMAFISSPAWALPRTWVGGNSDWIDNGGLANWSLLDEPDADDEAIFNTVNSVNLGTPNAVQMLTLLDGINLNTNGHNLTVDGLVQLGGTSTNLFIGGSLSILQADSVTINSGGNLQMAGGTLSVVEESGTGVLTINGGILSGYGTFSNGDALGVPTTVINNNGTITASHLPEFIFQPPIIDTLTINFLSAAARIDLDGSGENGIVNVTRNQTLDINGALSDVFNGDINLSHNSTLDIASAWTLGAGGATIVNNGAIMGLPGVPAGTATIAGGTLTQTGGTINVVDPDGTLVFDAPLTTTGGSFINSGHVIFNASSSITLASFDFDAGEWTVQNNALLSLNVTDYDPGVANNSFDASITLSNGDISIITGDAEFVMNGTLNMISTSGITVWDGEPLDIGNDAGSLDAKLIVTGTQVSRITAPVDFNADADVNVANGATLDLNDTVNFDTVNGGNHAQFTGGGTLRFNGTVNVNEAVALDVSTVDLDGADSVGNIVNVDAPMVINVANFTGYGNVNGVGGADTIDINNSVGTGVLTVNLDDPDARWTLNVPGVMNLVNDNTEATLLAGSDVNIDGIVNVVGDVHSTARLDIAGIVNINTAGQPLRLAGGTLSSDPNTINGGVINGAGLLGADTSRALRGFGTIITGIDFDGTAALLADNGTLTIAGSIVDVGAIGTFDADGTLHVTNAWNNNVSTGVQLNGGVLSGGPITNDVMSGISGHGLVTARVVNNTQLFASIGDSLILQTAGNDNDWDGTTNTGQIHAVLANIELRDNSTFGFSGTVEAANGHTAFTNGFALNFNPGSSLQLSSGGIYESTHSTDLGGTVTVVAGAASKIKVEVNRFLTFESTSSTTLNGNLVLENNNINIEMGAAFSGPGAVVIPDGSHLVADHGANIGALLDMQGTFRPGGIDAIGRIDLLDYQQENSGELFVELTGTALNAFDRLVVSGDAVLDGYLNIDIDAGFVPMLGQTFNIITANSISGAFDLVDMSGVPPGLTFAVDYLLNAVQLKVVSKPFFSADFDDDGDVDATDYAIWKSAFDLNQLGDANGDNLSNGADYVLWRKQLGSVPSPGAAAAAPEPSALAIALVLLTMLTAIGPRSRAVHSISPVAPAAP